MKSPRCISLGRLSRRLNRYIMWQSCDNPWHTCATRPQCVNSFRPEQNGRHFADDIFRCIFVNETFCSLIKIPLRFVPKIPGLGGYEFIKCPQNLIIVDYYPLPQLNVLILLYSRRFLINCGTVYIYIGHESTSKKAKFRHGRNYLHFRSSHISIGVPFVHLCLHLLVTV